MKKKALLEMLDYLHDSIIENSLNDDEWKKDFTKNFDEIKAKI